MLYLYLLLKINVYVSICTFIANADNEVNYRKQIERQHSSASDDVRVRSGAAEILHLKLRPYGRWCGGVVDPVKS